MIRREPAVRPWCGRWVPAALARTALVIILSALAADSAYAQTWTLPVCAEPDSLPFSHRSGTGFENRIAEGIAEEVGAELQWVWLDRPYARSRDLRIREGACDLVLGIPDGHAGFRTTLAYYRSPYVFVQRGDRDVRIESFDDPALAASSIAVATGGAGVGPATLALATLGLVGNAVQSAPDPTDEDPLAHLVRAVAEGRADVAIAFGPVGGYFAARSPAPLVATPVDPLILPPFVPLVASMSMGVRPGDVALEERLNRAIAARWDEIRSILAEYDVPTVDLPRPVP